MGANILNVATFDGNTARKVNFLCRAGLELNPAGAILLQNRGQVTVDQYE